MSFTVTAAESSNPKTLAEDYYHCTKDSDCTLVVNHCGSPISINRKYVPATASPSPSPSPTSTQLKLPLFVCQNFVEARWPAELDRIVSKCIDQKCTLKVKEPDEK